MKTLYKWFILILVSALPFTASGTVFSQLQSQMALACPVIWEDLGVSISSSVPGGDVWQGDAADRASFVTQYASANNATPEFSEQVADNLDAVAAECATYRLAVLDELLTKTPVDVDAALVSAGSSSGSGELLQSAWEVGNVRITGQPVASSGWVFLTGQTMGSGASGADLTGDVYKNLYELAKTWAPNNGSEDWTEGDSVTLPDMRGRTLHAADNMGGTAANVLTDPAGSTLGGIMGEEQTVLTEDQLPQHTHEMDSKGSHSHSMGVAGHHAHNQRTSTYGGTSRWGTHDYGGVVRGRTTYQNTLTKSIVGAGSHNHSIGSAGDHQHTINSAGNSAAVSLMAPSIVFNVEMKL